MASHEFSSSISGRAIPQWQLEYEAALKETDHKALFKRIEVAEAAILARREVLAARVPTVSLNGRKSRWPWTNCAG